MNKYPTDQVLDTKFIKVFDIHFKEGSHYYDVTRRDQDDTVMSKSAEEIKSLVPDAVSCEVVLEQDGKEPLLLLAQEYRYPIGQFLLSPTAGLIDPEDKKLSQEEAIRVTAIRELKEETGITFRDSDSVEIISPMLFSSPGMTDENNAMARIIIRHADLAELTQDGCVGSEQFDGFKLFTVDDAKRVLDQGCDDSGMFYSVYTWIALADFVANYQ
ncbi:MAG: NUDIX domain-containing protein [Clostridiales bacterium]|nr:NUDIX domain-containing protein [Candidatus Crickella equi]